MKFLLALAFTVALAAAGDWPQWRGPDRTGQVPTGVAVPESLPSEPKAAWRVPVGEGLSSPVVAQGRVFHLDDQGGFEMLHALDAKNGKELWRARLDRDFQDNQSPAGPRCTPLVDGGLVYVQSCRGELQCLNTADGGARWHVNFQKDFGSSFVGEEGSSQGAARHGYTAMPVIEGEHLIAAVGGTNGAGVVCFEKRTGKMLWKSLDDAAAYSSPVIAEIGGVRQLVYFSADALLALDPADGRLLWRVPLKTSFARHITTPVVIGDVAMVGSHEIGLVAVKVSRAGSDWQAAIAWKNKSAAMNIASPVAAGGNLYGLGPARNLVCVDPQTGKIIWSKTGYISDSADHASAAFMVLGKNILTLTDGGQLVLFAADPGGFREISRAQVCGKSWCNPAFSDGRIFLRDSRALYCVDLMNRTPAE